VVKIGTVDPISLLERKDKWFLGGGKGSIYAPPFPRWLEKPGFWDECFYADIKLTRLFTVLFCDSAGRPTRLRGELQSWRPDRLILEHRSDSHTIRETRLVTENQEWVSAFELLEGEDLQAFVWSMPEMLEPGYGAPWQSLATCANLSNSISWKQSTAWPAEMEADRTGIEDERVRGSSGMLPPLDLVLQLGANRPRQSFTINLAQRHDDSPLYETSLLPQKLRNGRLTDEFKLFAGPPPIEGFVHIVQQYALAQSEPLVVSCRASLTRNPRAEATLPGMEVVLESENAWRNYFASVPQFGSSDPHLNAAYWYRWYGLRLNTVDIPELPLRNHSSLCEPNQTFSPFVTEGVGFFRNFVTYSTQAHLREVAWMHSPRLGQGILENLAKCQREDGSFPGHNYSCRPPRDFYHADFATGAFLIEAVHSGSITTSTVECLKRYYRSFDEDRRGGFLFLIRDQNETGQEYMSRYQFATSAADQWATFKVAGVDSTHYLMLLAEFLGKFDQHPDFFVGTTTEWNNESYEIHLALEQLFDCGELFYCDALPNKENDVSLDTAWSQVVLSPARPATGLYPLSNPKRVFLEHINLLERWLLSPSEFWLPKGFPATALSDETFSSDAEWKDKRLNCPWNGRSWPMVNSHLVDVISNVARVAPTLFQARDEGELPWYAMPDTSLSKEDLRAKAGEALMKAITLMFHDGDPARPNSYEHYDPFTGTPSLYRGYDDYMHSWIVDLILRHAVGVQPGMDEVDPLPLGVDWIECTDIPHPRGRMSVRIEKDKVVSLAISDVQ
jgi:hypothetical protein